ncbi:TetR/AcrR family transcriptional regulator [uncultured Zobellia sp.]|uniref:TetR/AcrR family transcriptional regulator n=1 Tax=uncultured Zobellia sp. TaxID=255433 RepID=UPI0025995C7F|nr:TetR/AcrR family transcriptional regulator [uncultured Zobellia sp.]
MGKASNTRNTILQKAFQLIYKKGYQTTSIDEIIATTQVTKGAFYYHFKTKDEMGIAIINEIVKPEIQSAFLAPLQNSKNPTEGIHALIKSLLLETPFLQFENGCPISNLAQEMTPWNPKFSEALNELVMEWQTSLENIIQMGIDSGALSGNANPKQVAHFILSGYWGVRNLGKIFNSADIYHSYLEELKTYLDHLK